MAPEAKFGESAPGLIYMRDVADVVYGFKERNSFARVKAFQVEDRYGNLRTLEMDEVIENQVISLSIKRRPGSNILDTSEQLFNLIENFGFPAGTQVIITGDESQNIRTLLSDLENSIISGMLFVILVLVFFLGIRNALLVGAAVPLSIFVGFFVLNLLGFTINFIILFALIIALGLLVDNSVVIVENIFRYREAGLGKFDAAVKGATEVGGALFAATTTLVAAFLPLTFWPGIIGQFMSYLPLTLIIVLICSLFVALVLYPTLTVIFVRTDRDPKTVSSKAARILKYVILAFGGLVILLANWITFLVLIGAGIFFYVSYQLVIRPLGHRFTHIWVPAVITSYQNLLHTMLDRSYPNRAAWWKNLFALVSFTLGALLMLFSTFVSGIAPLASYIPLGLGGILLGLGVIGIGVHSIEAVIRGARGSLYTGL
jgi:multidrug efflux pump subunit AcrB